MSQEMIRAERLTTEARVALMRGETDKAAKCAEEAFEIAPRSVVVLEMLGDVRLAQNRTPEAEEAFKTGLQIAPGHLALEEKYAALVLKKAGIYASPESAGPDVGEYASAKSAAIINMILPGVGQIILGQTVKGAAFLVAFVFGLVLVGLSGGFESLLNLLRGSSQVSGGGFLSWSVPLLAYLWSQFDLASLAKRFQPKKAEHPVPPVDKPF
ncbi:MAG: hypothetical protein MH204_11150 [Fimbriimonadaceae bacterium]|nr:hypothetical protein [Fimbriimonadaceae bacterium]